MTIFARVSNFGAIRICKKGDFNKLILKNISPEIEITIFAIFIRSQKAF